MRATVRQKPRSPFRVHFELGGPSELRPLSQRTYAMRKFPPIKREIQACSFVRESRLATDDRCHLPPRADRIPRRLSSMVIDASVSAPEARMAWTTGVKLDANSSATSINAALPMLPA